MKQPSNAAHDACEALRTVNCPVGCAECSYDNDRFTACSISEAFCFIFHL